MADIYDAIKNSPFNEKVINSVKREIVHGIKFYNNFNQSRLFNAVNLFSLTMKHALFEIMFLLHYNNELLQQTPIRNSRNNDNKDSKNHEIKTIDLYVDNAPSGVIGMNRMPKYFLNEMKDYINQEFRIDFTSLTTKQHYPVTCISSLGSIGTIAHKLNKSDLDLQIQYDLFASTISQKQLNRGYISDIFYKVYNEITTRYKNHENKLHKLDRQFNKIKVYVVQNKIEIKDVNEYLILVSQIINLIDLHRKLFNRKEIKSLDKAFQKRVSNIEKYIKLKYPEDEIHFFVYSTDNYRQGKHGSTLVSKESSGSAYEKILTYETLMPGIIYNGVIPSHFIFGENVNNNNLLYAALISSIRLQLFDNFLRSVGLIANYIIDFGNTPILSEKYLIEHRGAVYWEAFKGSSGNLPKSYLNLLRLENLYLGLENRHTIIQLIKKPQLYQDYLSTMKAEADKAKLQDPLGLNYDEHDPFPLDEIYRIELQNLELRYDPWWIRYKMLKIFYKENLSLEYKYRQDVSMMIDICFALHIGLVDVLYSSTTNLNESESLRIRVLNDYFENAFPALTEKRQFIENVFQGEVSGVTYLEKKLKKLFTDTVNRILSIKTDQESVSKATEQLIWFKYYEQNFKPKPNQIPRNIISYFRKIRGRLQIKYDGESWNYKTVTTISERGKRFQASSNIGQSSSNVSLHIDEDMIKGLAYCIINKFYGAYSEQAIKMSSTLVELNTGSFTGLSQGDLKYAKVNSPLVETIASKINRHFSDHSVNYLQAMQQKFIVNEIIILINVLVFGRMQAIYRDHMGNYYFIKKDNVDLNAISHKFQGNLDKLLNEKSFHDSILSIIRNCRLNDSSVENLRKNVKFWINPLSVESESNLKKETLETIEQKTQEISMKKLLSNLNLSTKAVVKDSE